MSTSDTTSTTRFEPKQKPTLAPPRSDPITLAELAQCDGSDPSKPTLVAIKGTVFDVSKNPAYAPGGNYAVFAGKDPSRALAMSSLKKEDCKGQWEDLSAEQKGVLEDWVSFFSKRYNVVGKVEGGD